MKTLVCVEPGRFEYADTPPPARAEGMALLRVHSVGVCGTDIHAFEGTQPYFSYPRILGHELGCTVLEVDDGRGFAPGDAVTVLPYFHCGTCIACRSGRTNCCASLQVYGVHVDGGMRGTVSVPVSCLVHGRGLPTDTLAWVEPLAIGAHGVRRAGIRPDEHVLVIGAGPIGLGLMAFAGIEGAQVTAMDVNPDRLAFCRERLRVSHTVDPSASDAMEAVRGITGGDMPQVVIDATGSLHAINDGFRFLSHGGRYVLVGLQRGDVHFSHPEFHKREACLMSSRNAVRADFDHVLECIGDGRLDPAAWITHRVAFEDASSFFGRITAPGERVVKAVVTL